MAKKILMVVTNVKEMADGIETGLWLSEFAEPYGVFDKEGYSIVVASPEGGNIPLDPNSYDGEAPDEWEGPLKMLENTQILGAQAAKQFEGIFLPGGHGTMVDFPDDQTLKDLIKDFAEQDKTIGAVCHGPAGLLNVTLSNGRKLVDGRKLTSFTNEEEHKMNLQDELPFMLESDLRSEGADFTSADAFTDYVVTDGRLVTGQNPQSSMTVANQFVNSL